MDVLLFKALASVTIFSVALFFGNVPFWVTSYHQARLLLYYGEFFARGIFLGMGLIHFLPDALKELTSINPEMSYFWVFSVCAITLLIIQFLEDGINQRYAYRFQETRAIPYVLTAVLSVHSFIEGGALGLSGEWSHVVMVFIAIIVHKGGETFALAMSMIRAQVKWQQARRMIVIFSMITPIGIFFGAFFNELVEITGNNALLFTQGIFNAMAAGTFIYLGVSHRDCRLSDHQHSLLSANALLGLGIVVMIFAAWWLD